MYLVIYLSIFIFGIFISVKARGSESILISLILMVPLILYIVYKKISQKIVNSSLYNGYKDIKNELLTSYNEFLIENDKEIKKSLINKMNDFLEMDFHIPYYVELSVINQKLKQEKDEESILLDKAYKDNLFWLYQFKKRKSEIKKILHNIELNNKWPDYDYIRKLIYWDIEYKD